MTKAEKLLILKNRYNVIKARPDSQKHSTLRKVARQIRNLERG